ncbi:Gti1/Pac2 family-domain-containing protein [Mycena albidolilacea]|uniref:Gti1/Pac2 family-domain-containing protein n=1 Tax=Mycena albidolilacea TaxID=1033008 RepID=A0AAD7APN1_9AGAR|nr:Gti1/Pac2 family-domain-containing protein [Mycena albidolilacea]
MRAARQEAPVTPLVILAATCRCLIPRVTRRLVDAERRMIASGGIERWTDGVFWSPSWILGNFLLYRETDCKGAGHGRQGSDEGEDDDERGERGGGGDSGSLSRPRGEIRRHTFGGQRQRTPVSSLPNNYKFKADILMKKYASLSSPSSPYLTVILQTFSLTISGVAHLISGRLRAASSLPELSSLDTSPTLLDRGNFRCMPKMEMRVWVEQ